MMYGLMALYQVPLVYYQIATNSAVHGNPAHVTNNWNNFSKCLWTSKVIYHVLFFCISMSYYYDLRWQLLPYVLILLLRSLSSISFSCFIILFHNSTALTVIMTVKTESDKLLKDLLTNKTDKLNIFSVNFNLEISRKYHTPTAWIGDSYGNSMVEN